MAYSGTLRNFGLGKHVALFRGAGAIHQALTSFANPPEKSLSPVYHIKFMGNFLMIILLQGNLDYIILYRCTLFV